MAHHGPLQNVVAPPGLALLDAGQKKVGGESLAQQAQVAMPRGHAPDAQAPDAPDLQAPQAATPDASAPRAQAAPPAVIARRRRLDYLRGLIKVAVVPMLEKTITATMVAANPAFAGPSMVAGKTLVQPTLDWIVDQLGEIAADPTAFSDAAQAALSAAWNHPADVAALAQEHVKKLLPSRGTIGRGARKAVIDSSQFVAEKLFDGVAKQLTAYPMLSGLFARGASGFGRIFSAAVDLGLDTALPMVIVAASDVPDSGEVLTVCALLPAVVTKPPTEGFNGYYEADVQLADTKLNWFTALGNAKLRIGPEKRIASVSTPNAITLRIGKGAQAYRIGALVTRYGEHEGLALTGAMTSSRGTKATLHALTISPMGWVEGSFEEDGKPGKLGGTAPDGVLAPPRTPGSEDAREDEGPQAAKPVRPEAMQALLGHPARAKFADEDEPDAEASIPAPPAAAPPAQAAPLDELVAKPAASPLALGIHEALGGEHQRWLRNTALRIGGALSGHRNLAVRPPSAQPAAALPEGKVPQLSAWMAAIDPAGMLDRMSQISLVPDWLRTGYPRMSLVANELKIGREPSLSFGMSMGLQLFEAMPTLATNNVVVVWLPDATPTVRLRAADVSLGDNLVLRGLEADPTGGVRAVSAKLALPLPLAGFSIDQLTAEADYLVAGHGVDFRSAKATAKDLQIARMITVQELALSSRGNSRFSALVKGGHARVLGAGLQFDGSVDWGGGAPMTGKGQVVGGPLSVLGGKIAATKLAGSVDVNEEGATGTVSATGLVVRWNDYELTVSADIGLDRRGIAKFDIEEMVAHKAGQRVGVARGVHYVRGEALAVKALVLDVPDTGAVRGVREDADAPAQLGIHDLDLSTMIRAANAPANAAPRAPTTLSTKNLKRLQLGPQGVDPLLELELAADAGAPASTKTAFLSGDLRAFQIPRTKIEVGASTSGEGVRLALAGLAGNGWGIQRATYDDGMLTVTEASLSVATLFGTAMPRVFDGFAPEITTSFTIDTRTGTLASLAIKGALPQGSLFHDALKIVGASAALVGIPSALPAGALTNGLTLKGKIKVANATARAYGANVSLKGEIDLPSGTALLDGSGEGPGLRVDIKRARFGAGPPTFEGATVEVGAPANDVVKFVASPSALGLTDEQRSRVVVRAKRVAVDADGNPIAAEQENVEVTPAPQPHRAPRAAPPPAKLRTQLDVHVPRINIGAGSLVLITEEIHKPAADDTSQVTTDVRAVISAGTLRGDMHGEITVKLPRGNDGEANAGPAQAQQIANDPAAVSVKIKHAEVRGYVLKDVKYDNGQLTIGQATAPLAKLLAGVPAIGLHDKDVSLTKIAIDLGAKTIGVGGIGLGASNLSLLDGDITLQRLKADMAIAPMALANETLVGGEWALDVDAQGAELKLTDSLTATGSAKATITKAGLSEARLDKAKVAWGHLAAGFERATFSTDGWALDRLAVELGAGAPKLGVDVTAGVLPSWMKLADGWAVKATMDVARRKGQAAATWPALDKVELEVLAGGLALPGITGSFDRRTREARLKATPPKGGISASVQLPLAQGVGVEIVGSLEQQFALDTAVKLAPGDDLAFAGDVAASLALSGRLRVGIFGGVPYLFTVSAGAYAGIDLKAKIGATASGAWRMPKHGADKPESELELYMKVAGPDGKPAAITGEAGAYAAVKVLGYYKALEKPLAHVTLASLEAHGFARLNTATGLTLLPQGGFPAHHLHLHPALEKLLFDNNTEKALAEAQRNVDRGVAKAEASEELIDQKPPAALGAKPWQSKQPALQAEATAAKQAVAADERTIAGATQILKSDRDCLEVARQKLARYQEQLLVLELPAAQLNGKRGYEVRDGVIRTLGRAAMAQPDVSKRLDSYLKDGANGENKGLVKAKTLLDAAQTRKKIVQKQEEIAMLERRIDLDRDEQNKGRLKHAVDVDKHTKATRKAELAGKSRVEVEADHARRQDRLLALYDKLQQAHAQAHTASSQRTQRKAKIIVDQKAARAQRAALAKRGDASAAEVMFWDEQIKYLEAEEARLTEQEKVPPLVIANDAKIAIDRAARERTEAQREPLNEAHTAALEAAQREIERITIALSANFRALSQLADDKAKAAERTRLEQDRAALTAKLDEAQEAAKAAFAAASE